MGGGLGGGGAGRVRVSLVVFKFSGTADAECPCASELGLQKTRLKKEGTLLWGGGRRVRVLSYCSVLSSL